MAHIVGILEKYLWGSAYCEYHPGMEKRLSVEYKVGEGETVCYCPFAVNHVESELPFSYRVKPLG